MEYQPKNDWYLFALKRQSIVKSARFRKCLEKLCSYSVMEHPDFEKGHPTKYVPEICKTEGEKVWVGECNVCKKITSKTCQKCELQFYCNKKHEHHDKKSHRKECKMKIEAKQEWKNKKVLDLEQDILKVATDLFSERYVSYDKKLGTWCMMPVGVRNVNGRKGYLIQVQATIVF